MALIAAPRRKSLVAGAVVREHEQEVDVGQVACPAVGARSDGTEDRRGVDGRVVVDHLPEQRGPSEQLHGYLAKLGEDGVRCADLVERSSARASHLRGCDDEAFADEAPQGLERDRFRTPDHGRELGQRQTLALVQREMTEDRERGVAGNQAHRLTLSVT